MSATTSCITSTAHVEISLVSSPSSSSPGKLSLLSKQRLIVYKNVYYHHDISS